ncbi:unnamed protein product, partial [Phaeothamnion confervicola]
KTAAASNRERDLAEAEAAGAVLQVTAVLLLQPTNALALRRTDGALARLIALAMSAEHAPVLPGAAMALISLTPSPAALVRLRLDGRSLDLEGLGAYDALVRCREWVYGRGEPPLWLAFGLDVLGSLPDELERRYGPGGSGSGSKPDPSRPELFAQRFFFSEEDTWIPSDSRVASSPELRALLYKVY